MRHVDPLTFEPLEMEWNGKNIPYLGQYCATQGRRKKKWTVNDNDGDEIHYTSF